MRGVADAQKTAPRPLLQPIDAHIKNLHIVEALNRLDTIAREAGDGAQLGAEAGDAFGFHRREGTFRDYHRALPVIAAIEHDEEIAAGESRHRLLRIAVLKR